MRFSFITGMYCALVFFCMGKGAGASVCGSGRDRLPERVRFEVERLPELVVFEKDGRKEGVSAAYGGVLGESVLVAGGCNFPGIPASEGGEKVYYREIYALCRPEQSGASWKLAGHLPVAAANGGSVTLPEGVVCIGGKNADGPLKAVWLLQWNEDSTRIVSKTLPELPVSMDDFAVATDGRSIYVAGGCVDGRPENRCFFLENIRSASWKALPAFPGTARLQPVGGLWQGRFWVWGGFEPAEKERRCRIATDGICLDLGKQEWTVAGSILPEGETDARTFIGAAGQRLDEYRMFFIGGVNKEVFRAAVDNPVLCAEAKARGWQDECERLEREKAAYMKHEPAWYRFNREILVYDTEKDRWQAIGNFPQLARAGALIMKYQDKWIVVNGETKPGIRSSEVYMITVE